MCTEHTNYNINMINILYTSFYSFLTVQTTTVKQEVDMQDVRKRGLFRSNYFAEAI